jgi:hypothetical protein
MPGGHAEIVGDFLRSAEDLGRALQHPRLQFRHPVLLRAALRDEIPAGQ